MSSPGSKNHFNYMKNKFLNSILILAFIFIGSIAQAEEPASNPPLDTTAPIISLSGDSIVYINKGDVYVDSGATALDDVDGDISSNIISISSIDTNTVGHYSVSYNVKDFSLNSAVEVKRTVIVDPTPVTIVLKAYAGDAVLFDGTETVNACEESPNSGIRTINGKCAVEQSGLSNTWTWDYAPSGWMDELGTYSTASDYSKYWGWFYQIKNEDLNSGSTGLNQHVLQDEEQIVLTYNSYPLKISADKYSGTIGDTIVFTAEEKSTYDSNFNMIWTPSTDVVISIGGQSCSTVSDGTCSLIMNEDGVFKATGSKTLYVPYSLDITILPASSGGGGGIPVPTFSISNANNFLLSKQNPDGSFGDTLYTDWVAISAGISNAPFVVKLKNYLQNNVFNSDVITDNERHAMALSALGISPYNGTTVNYIDKIVKSFDGTQIGDTNLINDDIFGLIILGKSGYTQEDDFISKDISYVVGYQLPNGSWGDSADMTAAGLQALRFYGGNSDAINRAENYLIINQNQSNGGFGNNFSTSWALQAMSLNNSLSLNVTRAENYLTKNQQIDGGMEDVNSDISNRIWSTSYAIPAIMHKSFSNSLNNFGKYITPIVASGGGSIEIKKEIKKEEVTVKKDDLVEKIPEITNKEILPIKTKEIAKIQKTNQVVQNKTITIQNKDAVKSSDQSSKVNLSASAANSDVSDKIYKFMGGIFSGIAHAFKSFVSIFN